MVGVGTVSCVGLRTARAEGGGLHIWGEKYVCKVCGVLTKASAEAARAAAMKIFLDHIATADGIDTRGRSERHKESQNVSTVGIPGVNGRTTTSTMSQNRTEKPISNAIECGPLHATASKLLAPANFMAI